jgi:uncharacterized membrane protein HdeD (DUF308 family)
LAYASIGNAGLAIGTSRWATIALGVLLILAGLFVLGDIVAVTVVSAILFGIALVVAGVFEVIHSFAASHWGGFLLRLLVGAFYMIGGAILIANPVAASELMTLAFAAALIASGAARIFLAFEYWDRFGSLLLASGIVGILAGLVILLKWPLSGLWVLGLVVGIDLLLHGAWWVMFGLSLRHPLTAVPAERTANDH